MKFQSPEKMKVEDIMTENPITVKSHEDVDVAWEIMESNNFRHIPVINDEDELQGILSETDLEKYETAIRNRKLKANFDSDVSHVRVRQIMTKSPETVSPDTPLSEAGQLLLENKFSCLPVLEGNTLVGIVTSKDFVRAFVSED